MVWVKVLFSDTKLLGYRLGFFVVYLFVLLQKSW